MATGIREQLNESAALAVVVSRPRDLTRLHLKEIRLLLDAKAYSEANLKSAWRSRSKRDIAASIKGFIRQAALGDALLPFEQGVAQAMQAILARQAWTPVQRRGLERLAKQLTHEVVIDIDFVNHAFAQDGEAYGDPFANLRDSSPGRPVTWVEDVEDADDHPDAA